MNKKILFAGYEIGGQLQLLAETVRKRWISATAAPCNEDFRGYQNDIHLSGKGLKGNWDRFLFFLWALQHYQVFHFFWGVSLWSWWRFHLLDLPLLKLFRKKVVVHFRGLDIIDIRHFDYLRETNRGEVLSKPPLSRPDQLRKIKKWLRYADVVLVSEPDLFEVVPTAILSPQVIDMTYWQPARNPLSAQDGIIRIVHAPSSRRKKGTDFIEAAIDNLKKKGLPVELVLAEKLPHHKIKELYEISDIGIDQVLYGWHGKVSVELMALGKPVICNINEAYRKYRPDLPIVHADPRNLEAVVELLVKDIHMRKELGKQSREYVARYHDVEVVTDELLKLYGFEDTTHVKESVEGAAMW
ncbi:MAG: glycosyltransferase [Cyclobacteriaceae bacterium]|nr:glycosyltransferase [Cyclobacteriaceae bacterium]